jgi:hypothetical protein
LGIKRILDASATPIAGCCSNVRCRVSHEVDRKAEYEARPRRTAAHPAKPTFVDHQTMKPIVLALLLAVAAELGWLEVAGVAAVPVDSPGQPERYQSHLLLV